MGIVFPKRCSKLPCKKGERKMPFNPAGFSGIIAPLQPSNNPKCCSKNPNHIDDTIKLG